MAGWPSFSFFVLLMPPGRNHPSGTGADVKRGGSPGDTFFIIPRKTKCHSSDSNVDGSLWGPICKAFSEVLAFCLPHKQCKWCAFHQEIQPGKGMKWHDRSGEIYYTPKLNMEPENDPLEQGKRLPVINFLVPWRGVKGECLKNAV